MSNNNNGRKRQHSDHTTKQSNRNLNAEMIEKIEKHFSKLYSFEPPTIEDSKWRLPPAAELFRSGKWTNESLDAHKQELNSVKSLLNDKDIVQWRQHTQNVNLTGRVVQQLRNKFRPELCTQAWCKFYEIVCSFPLVPFESTFNRLNSVHLCEAPGAFIAALNHYLTLNHPHVNLTWLASTLNPYYEGNKVSFTITDDRFIFPTLANWDFGVDNTGNIFTRPNRRHLIKRADSIGPVHLITADGSIDCQDDPSEQEGTVAKLHLTEVVTALQILSPGGNLVIKMFTCFEHCSVSLIYLLNCAFTCVKMFKPGTSKMGNSEVYIVALNYKGSTAIVDHLNVIEDHLDDDLINTHSIFRLDSLPETFMRQMVECCGYFKALQIDAIRENLRLFETSNRDQMVTIETTKMLVASSFIQRFGIAAISWESFIAGARNLSKLCVQLKPWQVGSYNNRINSGQRPFSEKLALLESCLQENLLQIGNEIQSSAAFDSSTSSNDNHLMLVTGKKFDICFNSRFCQASILKLWHDLMNCIMEEPGVKCPQIPETLKEEMAHDVFDHLLMSTDGLSGAKVIAMDLFCVPFATKLEKLCSVASATPISHIKKILLADLRHDPSHWHSQLRAGNQARYLQDFCAIVEEFDRLSHDVDEASQIGYTLMLFTNLPLTRIGAGLLYILHGAFQKVSLHTVTTEILPLEIVLCQNYLRPISTGVLEEIRLCAINESSTCLEIVPITRLLDVPFYLTIHQFNCHALLRNMMCLIRTLKRMPIGGGAASF